jgi:hypothetical protein
MTRNEAHHPEFPAPMDQFPVRATFRIEPGICRNALELPSESTGALPKGGRKSSEREEFPVIFPVGRENEPAPTGRHPSF